MRFSCNKMPCALQHLHEKCAKRTAQAKRASDSFVQFSMQQVRTFGIFDFSMFKTALFSLGLLIGAHFSHVIRKFRPLVWAGFLFSYGYLIWRVFFSEKD